MNWKVSYPGNENEGKVWVELKMTVPVPRDATVRDVYFMLVRRKIIKRFPRKVKKVLYYGGSGKWSRRALRYFLKYVECDENN